MDASQLAQKMLEWEKLMRQADAIGKEIEDAVLAIGKTQTVGNVRVTYSSGRGSNDYSPVKAAATPELIAKYTQVREEILWKGISDELGIPPLYVPGPPSATIKLIG